MLRDPIGDYKKVQEKLDHSFKDIQDIATKFGGRLEAVPATVESTAIKLRKSTKESINDAIEELERKVDSLYDKKIAILVECLNQINGSVQKTPERIEEVTHALKEDVDALVAEKTMQLSEQIDRLPHAHDAMEAKIQVLFEALQGDFRNLTEQRLQKHSELITSFDQHLRSIKDISLQVTHEVEKIADVHRNARSHKTVLMVLLIITIFITCGDGVLDLLKLFHH